MGGGERGGGGGHTKTQNRRNSTCNPPLNSDGGESRVKKIDPVSQVRQGKNMSYGGG
jgi:hypothetical protein